MDTTGDEDLKLQRASADLIADLQRSLPHFLFKSIAPASGPSSAARGPLRRLVRETKTDQLIKLLEPFQEWPQLLDPYLRGLLQPLVSAFIDYVSKHAAIYHQEGKLCPGIIPLPRAISKILYVFCKVRGIKVISQFLNNEPKYLEPMLDALELWAGKLYCSKENAHPKHGLMIWEEGFLMLLWLSHLLLAPFDLCSMSSDNNGILLRDPLLQVELHATIPPIAKRLVHISTYHLSAPSKAREVAGILLVRLAVRVDMRRIGLQKILIDWALISIRAQSKDDASPASIYGILGILSFIAGFIVSAENEVLKPLLSRIYSSVQHTNSDHFHSSASARKLIIKIERALAVAGMKLDSKAPVDAGPSLGDGAFEDIVDHFLTALEDKDTPVRLAASKGLSVISVQLEPDMVEQIIDIVDERLYENTSWEDAHNRADLPSIPVLHLGAVSALRWHGLILALSQLIFRGSMPPHSVLSKVICSLVIALRFEQRSSLGNSVGTSVRDAACFGLWALARRYLSADIKSCKPFGNEYHDSAIGSIRQVSGNEMDSAAGSQPISNRNNDVGTVSTLQAPLQQPRSNFNATSSVSINVVQSTLQTLANELVRAATLDAAGNIRRGASAALQELVGRHPEEIKHGINLVQVVDYHGIALRSRAMVDIAVNVSRMEPIYWQSILRGLLDWRGVSSGDVDCRRNAARAIGLLAHSRGSEMIASSINTLQSRLQACEIRNTEERHGLVLALSEIVGHLSKSHLFITTGGELAKLWHISCNGDWSGTKSKKEVVVTDAKHFRSSLTCEAVCSLIVALASCSIHDKSHHPSPTELDEYLEAVEMSLRQSDEITLAASTRAAKTLFPILERGVQDDLVSRWIRGLSGPGLPPKESSVTGIAAALGAVFQHVQSPQLQDQIVDTLVYLTSNEHGISLRCIALRSLKSGVLESNVITDKVSQALHVCLNDYTTDRRGDVGSLIRLEAIDATAVVLKRGLLSMRERQDMAARICGLAVEKLDKVRFRAWNCLRANWGIFSSGTKYQNLMSDISQTSTVEYFLQFLSLCSDHLTQSWISKPLLEGYVTSGGAGSESLLAASRAAFMFYAESLDPTTLATLCTYLTELIRENISNDRLAVPTLDFLAFLFEAGILQRLRDRDFPWKRLFIDVRKAHFKSGNVQKIEAAVKIYAGMMAVPSVRTDVQEKLSSMLLHPYPKIRNVAADALLIVTDDESLMRVNWSRPQPELKVAVRSFRARFGIEDAVAY